MVMRLVNERIIMERETLVNSHESRAKEKDINVMDCFWITSGHLEGGGGGGLVALVHLQM